MQRCGARRCNAETLKILGDYACRTRARALRWGRAMKTSLLLASILFAGLAGCTINNNSNTADGGTTDPEKDSATTDPDGGAPDSGMTTTETGGEPDSSTPPSETGPGPSGKADSCSTGSL